MALFVGRIPRGLTSKELDEAFSKFGKLTRCDVKGGYGFVTYSNEKDAEEAISNMNNTELKGSTINVEWTKGKERKRSGRSNRYDPYRDDRRRSRSKSRSRSRSRSRSPRRSSRRSSRRSRSR
eukprot:GEZU01009014.1.p2 GENE.GEZU01009014.1~~GEZU01009014.1.p2  ORF type:complete len:123 (-),score=4.06 GEZU01009014.1:926-1294(-)